MLNADLQFRSASVVKLLIVLDFLWNRGPAYEIPAADRARLEVMLRSSDDDAASYYWDHLGGGQIIDRMVQRLGLTHTAGPPATHPGFWGYVALTAGDTVRIYRYLLDQAPAPVREYVMGNLHQATRYGTRRLRPVLRDRVGVRPDFSHQAGLVRVLARASTAASAKR